MILKYAKLIALGGLVIAFAAACATDPVTQSTADIANPGIDFAELERSDYEILDTVSGRGEVTEDQTTGDTSGDTEQYGYIGYMPRGGRQVETTQQTFFGFPVGPAEVEMSAPEGASGKARANASWEMIMAARDLDADAVIFVTTTEEVTSDSGETTYSVEMSGRAIRVNPD